MNPPLLHRRNWLARLAGAGAVAAASITLPAASRSASSAPEKRGAQRLDLDRLQRWEALGYGMFIHFGMSTFVANELPDGKAPATTYAPAHLDVDQWISVARDAGMKYAVLTTKHVAGHCLWPSRHTNYTVAQSADQTDVVEKFVQSCEQRGVLPGFYYCSWDNHNKFGSQTPSDLRWTEAMNRFPKEGESLAPFTTSMYQTFQTAQIDELLTQYGPIAEIWIDIPGVLGRGYRTFLYEHIAQLQPETVIMMNSGISTGAEYNIDYAWPSDLIAIERNLPPESNHQPWRTIEGKEYYIPGEVCDPIGKDWFYVEGDAPRSDETLLQMLQACRARRSNLLLDVPPDRDGKVPDPSIQALQRLKKNAGL